MNGSELIEKFKTTIVAAKLLNYHEEVFGNGFYVTDDKITFMVWHAPWDEKEFVLEIDRKLYGKYSNIEVLEKKLIDLL